MSYQQPPNDKAAAPAGWYPDTGGLKALRWWDGAQWTQHTQPLAQAQSPEPDAASGGAEHQTPGWPTQQLSNGSANGIYPSGRGALQRTPGSAPRRHRLRNILIASGGGLVLLLIGISIGSAGSKAAKPSPATTVTITAAAAPAPTVTITKTVRRTVKPSAVATTGTSAPAQSSGVLFTFSGSGIRNSAPFTVNSSAVTAHYSYSCSAFGSSGNFIADLVSGSPSSGNYDDVSIANELGSGGSQTTTVYPQDQGSSYHLEVNSECSWSITLTAS